MIGYPVSSVAAEFPENSTQTVGQNRTLDEEIADYCGRSEFVLVTTDEDFRTKWSRAGVLARSGVEVIVFHRDIPGAMEQHRRITLHYDRWQETLSVRPYGPGIWEQRASGPPRLQLGSGPKPKPKARVRTTSRTSR
jgi:hypothetical protein